MNLTWIFGKCVKLESLVYFELRLTKIEKIINMDTIKMIV